MPREAGDFVGTELDAADIKGKHGGGSKRWSNPADPLLSQMPVTGELQAQRLGLQASVLTLQRPGAPGQWGITANQHQRPGPAPTEVFRRRRHRAGGVAMGRPEQLPVAITAPTLGCDQLSGSMLKRLRRLNSVASGSTGCQTFRQGQTQCNRPGSPSSGAHPSLGQALRKSRSRTISQCPLSSSRAGETGWGSIT